MSYLDISQLNSLGLRSFGENVKISTKASIYGAENISIGNNVRIDDFSIISAGSGGVEIGNFVHIACFSSLIGNEKIVMEDFSGLSSRVSVYSSSDDYSGKSLTNPTVPDKYKSVISAPVFIRKHVIIGAGSVVLPGVEIGIGSAIGALSLVSKSIAKGTIASGFPIKALKSRSSKIFELEEKLKKEYNYLEGIRGCNE